ncbi:MAG: hypothetical protein UX07_C0037G0007 [Parcubacteria group bacterium GW2011_GWA2_45_30]|nr:MAG: hypothetical protein UX07_C0037G0007 [Parcubacteria group bacterium GW2011_GWA2_45_30]
MIRSVIRYLNILCIATRFGLSSGGLTKGRSDFLRLGRRTKQIRPPIVALHKISRSHRSLTGLLNVSASGGNQQ